MRFLGETLSLPREYSSVRNPVNSHRYTFTNNTVPNTEPIVEIHKLLLKLMIRKVLDNDCINNPLSR
ncbi:hypothetical protein H8356DRAFT_1359893 [Neocallimastix lanati (nom. inval.)]|nr:hypothetical protein H8356DRAFT_1359893 [Neocallimastix sp. JGI-2020a]